MDSRMEMLNELEALDIETRPALNVLQQRILAARARTESARQAAADQDSWHAFYAAREQVEIERAAQRVTRQIVPQVVEDGIRCTCGHTVSRLQVMTTSRGTSCPDCYDHMSD